MKNRLVIMLAIAVVATNAWASMKATVNGIEWLYIVSDGKAIIYNDTSSSYGGSAGGAAIPNSTTGAITIPAKLGGYPVTLVK